MAKQPFGNIQKGGLHSDLGIKEGKPIPVSLLRRIMSAKMGTTMNNPTNVGKPQIRITGQLKRRANFALNAKTKFHHG